MFSRNNTITENKNTSFDAFLSKILLHKQCTMQVMLMFAPHHVNSGLLHTSLMNPRYSYTICSFVYFYIKQNRGGARICPAGSQAPRRQTEAKGTSCRKDVERESFRAFPSPIVFSGILLKKIGKFGTFIEVFALP